MAKGVRKGRDGKPIKKKDRTTLVTREYTINFGLRLKGSQFKYRAPRAIRAIRKFAFKEMRTTDVRVTVGLNQYIWSQGIRNPPRRVRFQLSRKRNENKDDKQKFYTLVTHVPCTRDEFRNKTPLTIKEQ